jgi:hypothetical protein
MTPSSTRSATSLSASSNKLKQFRRLATRYDKLLANFMGFVKLAAIAIWLKELNRHYGLGQTVVRARTDAIDRLTNVDGNLIEVEEQVAADFIA